MYHSAATIARVRGEACNSAINPRTEPKAANTPVGPRVSWVVIGILTLSART
jgi:hypothetical protein